MVQKQVKVPSYMMATQAAGQKMSNYPYKSRIARILRDPTKTDVQPEVMKIAKKRIKIY